MHRWKQNIAIAEASGWERGPKKSCVASESGLVNGPTYTRYWEANQYWHKKSDKYGWQDTCPDFVGSLDQMHNAWETLTVSQKVKFRNILIKDMKLGVVMWGNATASQRAEAFLKTLGLWIENDPDDKLPNKE